MKIHVLSLKNLFISLAVLTLGACQSGYALPESDVDLSAGIPADAQAVALSIIEMLNGRDPQNILQVRMAPGADVQVQDKSLDYGDFQMTNHALIRHGVREQDSETVITAGILTLEDSLKRRTSVIYDSTYQFVGDEIVISSIQSATLFAVKPEASIYVVPRESIADSQELVSVSYDKLLELVRTRQITPSPLPEGVKDYLVFVFLKDRVSPSGELMLKITENSAGVWGYKDSATYMDFKGYRVGVLQGAFDVTNKGLYIKAVFKPGDELESGASQRVVGLYSVAGVAK